MTLSLHNIRPKAGTRKKSRRVGRGDGSGRGTYSTRGLKGQRSRAGGKGGLKMLGMKAIIQSMPKKRGFNRERKEYFPVNLEILEKFFEKGDSITPETLLKKKIIDNINTDVKILARGKLTKNFTIKVQSFSASAKKIIEDAGGTIESLKKYKIKK